MPTANRAHPEKARGLLRFQGWLTEYRRLKACRPDEAPETKSRMSSEALGPDCACESERNGNERKVLAIIIPKTYRLSQEKTDRETLGHNPMTSAHKFVLRFGAVWQR